MDVSIIVCCYNSESRIEQTIRHLSKLEIGLNKVELILVDNNCTDSTVDFAIKLWDDLFAPFKIIVVVEKTAGLYYARKKGVNASRGEFIVFCDDDNWLSNDYIINSLELFKNNTSIGIAAGSIEAVYEQTPPHWFEKVERNYAIGNKNLKTNEIESVWGAGMIVRSSILHYLNKADYQPLNIGRTGSKLIGGEDIELCLVVRKMGFQVWHSRSLKLKHFITKNRITYKYAKRLFRAQGYSQVTLDLYNLSERITIFLGFRKSWIYSIYTDLNLLIKLCCTVSIKKTFVKDELLMFDVQYLKGKIEHKVRLLFSVRKKHNQISSFNQRIRNSHSTIL